jgi:hypothetical protein
MGPVYQTWAVAPHLEVVQWTGGELRAMRAWRLVTWVEDLSTRLQSLSNYTVWPGPVFTADRRPDATGRAGHGVYAVKPASRPRLTLEFDWLSGRNVWVWGWVALTGRVIEHEFGYRAERAVVRRLRLGVNAHLAFPDPADLRNLVQELGDRYQCPVKPGYYEPRKAFRLRSFIVSQGRPLPSLGLAGPVPLPRPHAPTATPFTSRPLVPPRPPRKRAPRGMSTHGLRLADVVDAFRKAEQQLGTDFAIDGRGPVRWATLDARYSRVVRPATRSWRHVHPYYPAGKVYQFPRAIVVHAAKTLGVEPAVLIGREY